MAKNRTRVKLTGTGTWTVPAGVTSVSVYSEFNGIAGVVGSGQAGTIFRTVAGAAYYCGSGTSGQVGDNTVIPKSTPVLVVGGYSFACVATTGVSSYGIEADGKAYSWGANTQGQLGDNTIVAKSSPIAVVGGYSFVQLDAGGSLDPYAVALTGTGAAYAWGGNRLGMLGDGTNVSRSSPVAVVGGHSFIQVSAGLVFTLGLKNNGEVWAWGENTGGELGDGTNTPKSTPVQVIGGHSFVQISAGGNQSIALKANGEAWTWGINGSGILGDNTIVGKSSPVAVVGGHSFVMVRAGFRAMGGLKSSGEVYMWGTNTKGDLGDGTTTSRSSPVAVVGGHSFTEITKAHGAVLIGSTTHARKANGSVYFWGGNGLGEGGDNTTVAKSSPVLVVSTSLFTKLSGSTIRRVYETTPNDSIAYKTGQSPCFFGDILVASDITEFVLEYFS